MSRTLEQDLSGKFWLGNVVTGHVLGEYGIVEYIDSEGDTAFATYYQGRSLSNSYATLEQAIIGAIALVHDGPNSQAARFFSRMIQLDKGE